MTDTDIHSCGYYCDKPLCIKAQRDELREMFAKEWVDLTATEIKILRRAATSDRRFAELLQAKLKDKNK